MARPLIDYRDRVILITGASSGLGAELARQLGSAGARLGLTARRRERLLEVASEVVARGGWAEIAPADVTEPDQLRTALDELSEKLGPPDLLIVNAVIGRWDAMIEISSESAEALLQVNAVGAVASIEAVLPGMLARRQGWIAVISSLSAIRGLPGLGIYAGSKAFLSTLVESLRVELHPRGIGLVDVQPGFLRTPMTSQSRQKQPFLGDVEPAVARILRGIASGHKRICFPRVAAWLLALARYVPAPFSDWVISLVWARGRIRRQKKRRGRALSHTPPVAAPPSLVPEDSNAE